MPLPFAIFGVLAAVVSTKTVLVATAAIATAVVASKALKSNDNNSTTSGPSAEELKEKKEQSIKKSAKKEIKNFVNQYPCIGTLRNSKTKEKFLENLELPVNLLDIPDGNTKSDAINDIVLLTSFNKLSSDIIKKIQEGTNIVQLETTTQNFHTPHTLAALLEETQGNLAIRKKAGSSAADSDDYISPEDLAKMETHLKNMQENSLDHNSTVCVTEAQMVAEELDFFLSSNNESSFSVAIHKLSTQNSALELRGIGANLFPVTSKQQSVNPTPIIIGAGAERQALFPKAVSIGMAFNAAKQLQSAQIPEPLHAYFKENTKAKETFTLWKGISEAPSNGLPRVVVCGLYNAGKSFLLNMLTGHFKDEHFKTSIARETRDTTSFDHDGFCYVDTPGLDADQSMQDDVCSWQTFLTADILLFVHALDRELTAPELDILRRLHDERPNIASSMIVVLTHIEDSIEDSVKCQRFQDSIAEALKNVLHAEPKIFFVSNTSYKQGVLENKENLLKTRGRIQLLQEHLAGLHAELTANATHSRQTEMEKLQEQLVDYIAQDYGMCTNTIEDARVEDEKMYVKMMQNYSDLCITWKKELQHYDEM